MTVSMPMSSSDRLSKSSSTPVSKTELSSNWKKLQQQWQQEPRPSRPAHDGASSTATTSAHKRKALSTSSIARKSVKKAKFEHDVSAHSQSAVVRRDQASRHPSSSMSRPSTQPAPTSTRTASTSRPSASTSKYSSNGATRGQDPHSKDTLTSTFIPTKYTSNPITNLAPTHHASSSTSSSFMAAPLAPQADDGIDRGMIPDALAWAGKYVALDCEMVGVGPNPERESALARATLVDFHGRQLYDAFVRPPEAVTDYRTWVSGVTPAQLARGGSARSLAEAQCDVAALLQGRILVGHAVQNDLDALLLSHPRRDIRDTSRHAPYRKVVGGRTPGLKRLARDLLGLDIQAGAHSSLDDARATMALFRRDKAGFDQEHRKKFGQSQRVRPTAAPDHLDQIRSIHAHAQDHASDGSGSEDSQEPNYSEDDLQEEGIEAQAARRTEREARMLRVGERTASGRKRRHKRRK